MSSTIGALGIAITGNTAAFVASTTRARNELRSFAAQANTSLAAVDRGFTQTSASAGALIARYVRWAIVIQTARRALEDVAKQNTEAGRSAAKAIDDISKSWVELQGTAAPAIAWITNRLTDMVNAANNVAKGIKGAVEEIKRAPILGGSGSFLGPLGAGTRQSGFAGLDDKKNWTTGPFGFPVSGVTDLTPEMRTAAAAAKKAAEDAARTTRELAAGTAKFLSDLGERQSEEIRAAIEAEMDFRSRMFEERLDLENRTAEDIRAINEDLDQQLKEALEYGAELQKEYADKAIEEQQRVAEAFERSMDDIAGGIEDLVRGGITDFKRLGDALFNLGGGKMPSWLGGGLKGLTTGAQIGSSFGTPIGGGIGGAIGSIFGPIGTIAGSLIGSGIGSLFKGKPSNNRATATFMPGMTDFGLSGDKPNDATLGGVQQAAALIAQQIAAFKAVGVEFTSQLSNIWLGERDASTYQLAGGQRISTGTVGDPDDLAADVLAALLKSATSSDPAIAKMLAGGGNIAEIQQALAFSMQITDALLQITDPLEYALTIWERTARANLAMAELTGFSLEKVREYNAALYQQTVAQINGPAIAGLGSFIDSLKYGSGSAASPQNQITAAFADYDAARQAALANPTAQTAGAFQQAAGSYLPMAREFYGSGGGYDAAVGSAISAAQQLQLALGAPAMPDLQPLIQQTAISGALTTEAVQQNTAEVRELRSEVARSNAIFGSLMAKFAATTP